MKRAALALLLVGLAASPAFAQGRGNNRNNRNNGVPPGQMPPPGLCRVWYDGVPPGRQPEPVSCYDAERIASRDRNARVIYGSDSRRNDTSIYRDGYPSDRYPSQYPGDVRRDDGDYRRYPNTDGRRPNPDGRNTGRTAGRDYPNSGVYSDSRRGYTSEAFRKGYEDGVYKGREDVDDRDSFDPARHSWYRSADRGYNSRYGAKEQYRADYRRGFLDGYESVHDGRRRPGASWWPF